MDLTTQSHNSEDLDMKHHRYHEGITTHISVLIYCFMHAFFVQKLVLEDVIRM
jgi:hypothetical protein